MKRNIAIIFGGKSAEHEVSLRSAKNVISAMDITKYSPIIIGISKEGSWYHFNDVRIFEERTALVDGKIPASGSPVAAISLLGKPVLFNLQTQNKIELHAAFPVLHGTMGEDGAIQGLFKMINLPFVGCGIWGSAAGMDKEVMKRLLTVAGIANAKYRVLLSHEPADFKQLTKDLGLPFFIKPANAGSSVGVHKIKSEQDFNEKLKDAFLYDHKVLAEEFIEGREIECSVMGLNHSPRASVPGEIIPQHEFYSYEAKYLDDNGALLNIPAKMDAETMSMVQKSARQTFTVMGCDGLTRVDFFLKKDGSLYVNEINTIPGFTKISMYPKMWEASGLSYKELITELIELGFEKYTREAALKTTFLD